MVRFFYRKDDDSLIQISMYTVIQALLTRYTRLSAHCVCDDLRIFSQAYVEISMSDIRKWK